MAEYDLSGIEPTLAPQNATARKFAEMLMSQNQQPQGQMISGRYVKPSIFQQLQPVANMLTGAYLSNKADEQTQQYADAIRKLGAKETADILGIAQGKEAVPGSTIQPTFPGGAPMRDDETGALMPNIVNQAQPAMPGDPKAALARALMSQSPQGKALIAPLLQNALPKKTDKQIEYEQYKLETPENKRVSFTDWSDRNEKAKLALDEKRYGLDAARFNLEKTKLEVNPAEAPLRTSFLNQAAPHIQISQAYRKIASAPDTAAGDMSLIFGYMKILDPGSTVREGEYASAENTRGVPDAVRAQYNRSLTGKRLVEKQRTEFTQAAGDLVKSQENQFNEMAKFYSDVSGRNRINPENVIYNPYKDLTLQTTPPKAPKQSVNLGQQLNIPQSNIINQADAIISGGK